MTCYVHTSGRAQCSEADSDMVYAYSHVKSAYEANNLTHLKYYANRSKESFERVKAILDKCGNCQKANNLTYDNIEYLSKVEEVEKYETGRYYTQKAKELSVTIMDELALCSQIEEESPGAELASLAEEQERLKDQQEALKRQEEELKQKLAEQKEKELLIKKEELIKSYQLVINDNVENYNKALKICGCNENPISASNIQKADSSESLTTIKNYYIDYLKTLTSSYLDKLSSCAIN